MTNSDALLDELVAASTALATVAHQAGILAGGPVKDSLEKPIADVRKVLARCPGAEWDGKIRDEDLEIEFYAPMADFGAPRKACKVTHITTGISCASESKATAGENKDVALRYVEKKLAERSASA